MWITLLIWVIVATLLTIFAPSSKDYQVSSVEKLLPDHLESVIAEKKVDQYFKDADGLSAILVFEAEDGEVPVTDLIHILGQIEDENINGVKEVIPLEALPPQALETFFSDDQSAAFLPLTFEENIDTKEVKVGLEKIYAIAVEQSDVNMYVTGPAGIAVDTTDLFTRADLVLLFSTVGIILVLLIFTYRSPLLALIPLLGAGFVYQVVNQVLGLMGKAGVELANQSLSIMMILLFAVVIDYSLFIFSRFREELVKTENKYEAMKLAMREIGIPIFYSGSTILLAMLILFFAQFGDYRNFAPIFGVAVFIVMIASVTLVPALFTLFGRHSFWPKIPRLGDELIKSSSVWKKVGRLVANKPVISVVIIGAFLILSASNIFNITYEFNTMKSFPDDMPSRLGYEILEESFNKGDLAPTTVLFESEEKVSEQDMTVLAERLSDEKLVGNVRINDMTEDGKVISYSLTFSEGPYDVETMNALEKIRDNGEQIISDSNLKGKLHFAGETAYSVDNRLVSDRDLIVIVILETILIFSMLIFLTKSLRLPILMMGTILLSFVAALGLGVFLTDVLFDIDTISNRVPVYAFVFLVALGIDYNIFLVSRYLEEREHHPVKEAVEIAVANTGGVISSAGIVLAATFAVLMTQPIEILFVFGFIVAVGILLDTFLIRGVLMPGLLVLFEKDRQKRSKQSA
ncbi:MAG TPA: MMPL family transporter [Cerasibacillus sp.]|uniref:MMPL family transporter n=1 Tax=Cerasibacillus sp. TaxID=2498711 RepID=UPI002F3EDE87